MAGIGAGYDLSVSTFSPDGRVFQVEYATKAVDSAPTVATAVLKDGIVFVADSMACGIQENVNTLANVLQAKPTWRVYAIDESIGAAIAGLVPDAQCIIRRAQQESASFFQDYGVKPPIHVLAQRVALFVHAYTLYWHVRPFGAAILLGGRDDNGEYTMYCIEPSGSCYRYEGMAIGKGKHVAKTELEKISLKEKTCRDCLEDLCLLIMQSRDDEYKTNDIQLAWICPDSNNKFQFVPNELVQQVKQSAEEHSLLTINISGNSPHSKRCWSEYLISI
ncbi:bifunctional Proteasome alpha-subunit [Babesia duncani]|uniref:Proteasome subunit alpha type n=1 Tax=Babesia duncani TaxID=323732 RepID=A0AAD9PHP5_9APIC|nr:bifunctional Proteasome alpha-subunit [Babesia duncani]